MSNPPFECDRCRNANGNATFSASSQAELDAHIAAHNWLMNPERCRFSHCFEASKFSEGIHCCSANPNEQPKAINACPIHCSSYRPLDLSEGCVRELAAVIIGGKGMYDCGVISARYVEPTLYLSRPTPLDAALNWATMCGQDPYEVAHTLLERANAARRIDIIG